VGYAAGLAWRAISLALGGDLAGARRDAVTASEVGMPEAPDANLSKLASALVAVQSADSGAIDLLLAGFAAPSDGQARIAFGRLGHMQLLAAAFARHGATEEAARILGFAKADASRVGITIETQPFLTAMALGAPEDLRAALGDGRFEELHDEGASMNEAELRTYVQRGRGGRGRPPAGWGSLTPTERQVVELVTEGLTNKDIAAKLFMSVPTVKSHLTHVYGKLGLTSRAALTAEAVRRA
jgi:DNA-binding CsgD family transcriptional regulator